jgi:hypothetical protein
VTTTVDRAAAVLDEILPPLRSGPRGAAIAADLHMSGLLADGETPVSDPRQVAANVMQCRLSWPDAERAAEALANAGLLVEPSTRIIR